MEVLYALFLCIIPNLVGIEVLNDEDIGLIVNIGGIRVAEDDVCIVDNLRFDSALVFMTCFHVRIEVHVHAGIAIHDRILDVCAPFELGLGILQYPLAFLRDNVGNNLVFLRLVHRRDIDTHLIRGKHRRIVRTNTLQNIENWFSKVGSIHSVPLVAKEKALILLYIRVQVARLIEHLAIFVLLEDFIRFSFYLHSRHPMSVS